MTIFILLVGCNDPSNQGENLGQKEKKPRTKTIILFDVSGSFNEYIPNVVEKIKLYVDKIPMFEDITLRKIGVNEDDKNFITELDLTTGFIDAIMASSIQCNQYSKEGREECEKKRAEANQMLLDEFRGRKEEFKNKVDDLGQSRESNTDIITSIEQSLRDLKKTTYDRRRIVIFSDMDDLTGRMATFELMVDEIDYLDELLVFYAEEKYADLIEDKIIGDNVKIYHISITDSGFNRFIESI
jgi:hypothetical protein